MISRLDRWVYICCGMAVLLVACGKSASPTVSTPPTPTVQAPTATPVPAEQGVHTPEQLRQYTADWPAAKKIVVDKDVVVLFAYSHPTAFWAGAAFVHHIPSMSSVIFDYEGQVSETRYKSVQGQRVIEAILDDETWLERIRARIREIRGEPAIVPTDPPIPSSTPTPRPTSPAPKTTPLPLAYQLPNHNSFASQISPDGRYVAFQSWADNLVAGDTNERPDVFVYDRYTGQTVRASVASDGTESDGFSDGASISAYGQWIAFASEAKSLAPNQRDWAFDVFLRDQRAGRTERIAVGRQGSRSRATSTQPALSADGRHLALIARADAWDDLWQVYVIDRQTGREEQISSGTDGRPGNGWSHSPAISADGRYVAFWSYAGNLVDDDERDCGQPEGSLSCSDVFVYDRQTRTMERIPVGEGYGLGGGGYALGLSADGRYVVFRGTLYNHQMQTLSAFCGLDADAQSKVRTSTLSADGRWIAFTDGQVHLCDRQNGTVTPISMAPDGTPGDGPSGLITGHEGYSGSLSLSADGRWLAFTSQASNLVPGQTKDERCQRPLPVLPDAPHCYDVYLYDRVTGTTALLGDPWRTAVVPAPTPTPLPALDALESYEPVTDDAEPVVEALAFEITRWLDDGIQILEIAARLDAALPDSGEPVTVQQVDLTGDGLDDVAVHVPLMGLPLLVLVQQEGIDTTYQPFLLPLDREAIRHGWSHSLIEAKHGVDQAALHVTDLTGDGVTDLVITHGYAGASNFRTSPRAYWWQEGDFRLIFSAELTSWAGYSTLHLEPDPAGGQVIRLSYPVFLPGRTPKGDPSPRGEQFWRWNQDVGRYQLAWQTIGPAPLDAWTADLAQAEAALIRGAYDEAVALYEAFLADQVWQNTFMEPYTAPNASQRVGKRELAAWLDFAHLRRGIALALSGRINEVETALAQIEATEDLVELAQAFLDGYAPSQDAIAGLAAYERRRADGPTPHAPEKDLGGNLLDCPAVVTYRAFLPEPLLVLAALAEFGTDDLAAALAERDTPVSEVTVDDLDRDGTDEVLWIGAPPWRVSGIGGQTRSDWQQVWVAWQGDRVWQTTGLAAADRIELLGISVAKLGTQPQILLALFQPDLGIQHLGRYWDGVVNRPQVIAQPPKWPDVGWPDSAPQPTTPPMSSNPMPGNLILYVQDGNIRSLPHPPVLDRPELADIYSAVAESENGTSYLGLEALDVSPDGRWLVVHDPLSSGPDVRLPGTMWLIDLARGTLRNLGSPRAAVTWSPDGHALAYANQDTLYVLDLASDTDPVAIWQQPGKRLFAARWSPTGEWIAVVGTDAKWREESNLDHWIVSPDSKTVVDLGAIPLPRTQWSGRQIEWAPDGSLFSTYGGLLLTLDGERISLREHRNDPAVFPESLPPRLAEELALRDVSGELTWVRAASHDGRKIAYGIVYLYDRASQTRELVSKIEDRQVSQIRWGMDDSTLIVGAIRLRGTGFDGAIYAMHPETGSVPELLIEGQGVYLLDVVPNETVIP